MCVIVWDLAFDCLWVKWLLALGFVLYCNYCLLVLWVLVGVLLVVGFCLVLMVCLLWWFVYCVFCCLVGCCYRVVNSVVI